MVSSVNDVISVTKSHDIMKCDVESACFPSSSNENHIASKVGNSFDDDSTIWQDSSIDRSENLKEFLVLDDINQDSEKDSNSDSDSDFESRFIDCLI